MLEANALPAMVDEVGDYLHATLGLDKASLRPRPWAGANRAPFALLDFFNLVEVDLVGHIAILALCRDAESPLVSVVRRRLNYLRRTEWTAHVIYVTPTLSAYQRKRLIELKIPFIVPMQQLYLPQLGMALRERFPAIAEQAKPVLSPSTQAIVINILLTTRTEIGWHAGQLAARTGVSLMTASRALRELRQAGAITMVRDRRNPQIFVLKASPTETWARLRAQLRDPVMRTAWFPESAFASKQWRYAGIDALSRNTMISPPPNHVVALGRREWANLDLALSFPEPDDGLWECQMWHYPPIWPGDHTCADPLSLWLALAADPDDRVQLAIDEMVESLKWEEI